MKVVFSISRYEYFMEEFLKHKPDYKKGGVQKKRFEDGERNYTLNVQDIKNNDIILIGGTVDDQCTLELFDLGSAIVKYGAKSLKIICPYFGYSTMERAVNDGEIVMAKTRARLVSAIPVAREGNSIELFDLHSEGIPFYFEGNIVSIHRYGKSFVKECVDEIIGSSDKSSFVIASTDAGRAKWVESLGKDLHLSTAFVYKQRVESGVKLSGVNADVNGKNLIIYDDMIRSGSSLRNAIDAYKTAGAKDIYVICTHGLFTVSFFNKDWTDVKSFYCSNSYAQSNMGISNFVNIKIKSVVNLFDL